MEKMNSEDFLHLTWREKSARFHDMAKGVAKRFGMDDPGLQLVGDMEGHVEPGGLLGNVKFRVAGAASHLLNIYYVFSGRLAFHHWGHYLSGNFLAPIESHLLQPGLTN